MEDPAANLEPMPPPVVAFRPKGHPLIAWLVILAAVGFVLWRNAEPRESGGSGGDGYGGMVLRMQARYLVGAADILRNLGQPTADLGKQLTALDTGSIRQRLSVVVLTGELVGPDGALTQLDALQRKLNDGPVAPTATEAEALATLRAIYVDYAAERWDAPSVDEARRAALRKELGWFADLALAPAAGPQGEVREEVLAPTRTVAAALIGFVLGFFILGGLGLVGLAILGAVWFAGKLQPGLYTGSPAGGVYAETFAVWMVLFLGLGYGAGLIRAGSFYFLVMGCAMLLSLAALAWPVLRGFSWRQVREDLGLTLGRRPVREVLAGLGTYAMALPMLAVGLLMVMLLMKLRSGGVVGNPFQSEEGPSHPITEVLAHLGWFGRLQVLLLGSVVAPIVEETMFRGVLYRHLRESSAGWGRAASALVSATVVSFIFAVIHPQGMLAVPALMALAFAFALAREWRGTLLPAMVAHGVNNAAVLSLVILVMAP